MQRRQNYRPARHNPNYLRAILLCLALFSLLLLSVSASLAYYRANTEPITNILSPGVVSCQVIETMDQTTNTKSNVSVKNDGNTKAYIRVALVANFSGKGQGEIIGKQPLAGTDYTIAFHSDLDSNWFKIGSYYYLKKPLEAGSYSPQLIDSIQPSHNSDDYALQVDILAEAIQAEPSDAVKAAWPVTVNSDGSLSKP